MISGSAESTEDVFMSQIESFSWIDGHRFKRERTILISSDSYGGKMKKEVPLLLVAISLITSFSE